MEKSSGSVRKKLGHPTMSNSVKVRSHIRSPRDDSILKVSRVSVSNSSTDENFRSILHEALIKVMKVTIALHTNDTVHDKSATDFHLQHRAEQSVRQELETIMDRMDRQTTTGNHMLTAYSQLSLNLLAELELVTINSERSKQFSLLKADNLFLKEEASRLHASLSDNLARKQQWVDSLQAEIEIISYKNKSLLTAINLLEQELDKSKRITSQLGEANINLCMQTLHIKGEIERNAKEILNAVQIRLGFVPNIIRKNVQSLCRLKVPMVPPDVGKNLNGSNISFAEDSGGFNRSSKIVLDTSVHSGENLEVSAIS